MSPAPGFSARRIRNAALSLGCLALAVYAGFIALLFYRSHH